MTSVLMKSDTINRELRLYIPTGDIIQTSFLCFTFFSFVS